MGTATRTVILVSITLFTSACSKSPDIDSRKIFWEKIISSSNSIGAPIDDLVLLLNEANGSHSDPISVKGNSIFLERIPVSSPVCSEWVIIASIESDDFGVVQSYTVDAEGICL